MPSITAKRSLARPRCSGGVARMTRHSGQSTIKVSLQHDKKELLVEAIKLVSKTLCRFISSRSNGASSSVGRCF